MKNKFISLILACAVIMSVPIFVFAEESFAVTAPEMVTLTVNGEEVTGEVNVNSTDVLAFVQEDAILIVANETFYLPGESFSVDANVDFSKAYPICDTGLKLVSGAQVRIGTGTLGKGEEIDAISDSGLRFIATADYNDTLVSNPSVEFGIKLQAEGNDNVVYVPAAKFQNEDRSVFSAAITNLSTSNYNRVYYASAYAKVALHNGEEKEFTVGKVGRSIYQVSVGIMKNSSSEADSALPYTIDDDVKNVLNSYINQTGIRLTYNSDGSMVVRQTGNGTYTGSLFFDVEYTVNDNNSTTVTIIPYGEEDGFGNSVEITEWWKNYVRINNNNSTAKTYITDDKIEDGVLTFTFTMPGFSPTKTYAFDQDDDVMIVSEITDSSIKGFEAGEEVSYDLTSGVAVMGLSKDFRDVTPGSVVLLGKTEEGKCAAIELLATIGDSMNSSIFEKHFGVYAASDESTTYQNIVGEMHSKSSLNMYVKGVSDTGEIKYIFNKNAMCYRVYIDTTGETPVVTCVGNKITTYPSIFADTSEYHNYLYLRYSTSTKKVTQCVYYVVDKDVDFSGDGDYSDPYNLGEITLVEEE